VANYSKVILLGKLGKDPKLFSFDKGSMVVSSLAVNRKYKDDFIADWYSLKSWGYAGEQLRKAQKGDSILVEGSLEIENYQDKNNNSATKVTVTCSKVILLTMKTDNTKYRQNEELDDVPF
jgi:single stranded DNA-binding protein